MIKKGYSEYWLLSNSVSALKSDSVYNYLYQERRRQICDQNF